MAEDWAAQFTLYDAAAAGTQLFTETQSVTPQDGLFTAYLGTQVALDLTLFQGCRRS